MSGERSVGRAWLAPGLWAAGVLVLLCLPPPADVPEWAAPLAGLPFADKLVHTVLFFVLTALLARGPAAGRAGLPAALAATAYGGLTELVQAFLPYRDASLGDIAADALGAAAFAAVAALARRRPALR